MKLNEKIHISLAVDSDNNTSFDLDPNEDLDTLCPNIIKKYNLSQKVEKNLKKYIENFIKEEIKKEKEKKKIQKQKAESCVLRLYNQSMENEKKKKECLKKLKEEKFNDFVNKFSFKPKIYYHERYERNYDKIENKLLDDGKKSKEKHALRRIAKEIERRNYMKTNIKKKNVVGFKNDNSSNVIDEKKNQSNSEFASPPNPPNQMRNSIINVLDNHIHNNNNLQISQTNNNQPSFSYSNNCTNTNNNYQILIQDENNKIINKDLEVSILKNTPKNTLMPSINMNTNRQSQILKVETGNYLNSSINKNSSKTTTNKMKNLDNSITNKESQVFRLTFQNKNSNLSNSAIPVPTNPNLFGNKKYSEQYLKQKNSVLDNLHNNSMHLSAISQKKNESLIINPLVNNNNQETKNNKDLIFGNRNSTTNQIIQNYNSAMIINKSISFKKESNLTTESKEKSIKNSKEKVYNKKIISKKNNLLKKKKFYNDINYNFKTEKRNSKFNSLYEHSKERRKAKEEHYQHIISSEYSFRPILTEASREYISKSLKKNESRDEFYNRLSNSKRIKNLSMNLKRKDMSLQTIATQHSHKNAKRSFSNKSTYTNKIITTTEETELRSYKNMHSAGTNERDESTRLREVKQSKELIENIKHQQCKEKKLLNNCSERIMNNMNKFKLNNLKEIFEIIYNNCSNIDDIQNIENYGINSKIKDKLILPTCHIMKERNLEFNFQNFFLISNEIINLTIDV